MQTHTGTIPFSVLTVTDCIQWYCQCLFFTGHKGSAVAKVFKLFKAENGEHFNVSSTSEWVQGKRSVVPFNSGVDGWQIGWITLFIAMLSHLGRVDSLAAIYAAANPSEEHARILSPIVSGTLWITGILFPLLYWVWNSISYDLRDHTQPLTSFNCIVIMSMFQTTYSNRP